MRWCFHSPSFYLLLFYLLLECIVFIKNFTNPLQAFSYKSAWRSLCLSILWSDFTENSRPVRNSSLLQEGVVDCTSSEVSAQQITCLNTATSLFGLGNNCKQTWISLCLFFMFWVLWIWLERTIVYICSWVLESSMRCFSWAWSDESIGMFLFPGYIQKEIISEL